MLQVILIIYGSGGNLQLLSLDTAGSFVRSREGEKHFMALYIKLVSKEFVFKNVPFKWISSCLFFFHMLTVALEAC